MTKTSFLAQRAPDALLLAAGYVAGRYGLALALAVVALSLSLDLVRLFGDRR